MGQRGQIPRGVRVIFEAGASFLAALKRTSKRGRYSASEYVRAAVKEAVANPDSVRDGAGTPSLFPASEDSVRAS